jgi:hypothetical protein
MVLSDCVAPDISCLGFSTIISCGSNGLFGSKEDREYCKEGGLDGPDSLEVCASLPSSSITIRFRFAPALVGIWVRLTGSRAG